jgi:hypothetical protein
MGFGVALVRGYEMEECEGKFIMATAHLLS